MNYMDTDLNGLEASPHPLEGLSTALRKIWDTHKRGKSLNVILNFKSMSVFLAMQSKPGNQNHT